MVNTSKFSLACICHLSSHVNWPFFVLFVHVLDMLTFFRCVLWLFGLLGRSKSVLSIPFDPLLGFSIFRSALCVLLAGLDFQCCLLGSSCAYFYLVFFFFLVTCVWFSLTGLCHWNLVNTTENIISKEIRYRVPGRNSYSKQKLKAFTVSFLVLKTAKMLHPSYRIIISASKHLINVTQPLRFTSHSYLNLTLTVDFWRQDANAFIVIPS